MAKKKELCRKADGLLVRNLGWKRSPSGYTQHKFYLGRDEAKAKIASARLEHLWEQVCKRWEQARCGESAPSCGGTVVKKLDLFEIPESSTVDPQIHPPQTSGSPVESPSPRDSRHGFLITTVGVAFHSGGERERAVWDETTLALADAIRNELEVARVSLPQDLAKIMALGSSVGDWLDRLRQDFPGIRIEVADPDVNRQAEADLTKAAQRLIDLGKQRLVRQAGGESLHAALSAYSLWIDTKFLTVDRKRTAWGGTQVRQVEFIRRNIPDLALLEMTATRVEEMIDILRMRPPGEDGTRVSVSWTKNCLKQFRHFLKWLNRHSDFAWTRPSDLEIGQIRIPTTPQEKTAAIRSTQVSTYTLGELKLLWEYASPFQRLLMLLGLNCGFGRAEIASLELNEVQLHQAHTHAKEVSFASTKEDSWIFRVRHKSGVYGEWKLWPQTVAAIEWWQRQRAKIGTLAGATTLLLTRKGNRYDAPTKGNHPNYQIPSAWFHLADRIRKDHPEFRRLSFNKLRKTAGNLIRREGDGEVAGVFLCHGTAVPSDRLLDLYTNRPFNKVFATSDRVGELLQAELAGVADPFPAAVKKGGPNISLGKIRRIQRLKGQGFKVRYIAETIGVSEETVRRWTRKAQ